MSKSSTGALLWERQRPAPDKPRDDDDDDLWANKASQYVTTTSALLFKKAHWVAYQ